MIEKNKDNHSFEKNMKRLLIAAVLLLGLGTTMNAQVYDDPFAARAIHNAHMDERVRGWKLSVDGGGQRTWGVQKQSFNNSRFDAEVGYRFNRHNYLGASVGISAYRFSSIHGSDNTQPAQYSGAKVGIPLSLVYRGYLVAEEFASPYMYVRGNACTSKIEDYNLGVGLGVDFQIGRGATVFAQAGVSGLGFVRGNGFFKSRLDAASGWTKGAFTAGPVGDLSVGVSIPLSLR